MDSDHKHDEESAAPLDPEEQHEVVMDRRSVLKRVGLGAAALSVPASVMASPAFGAVTGALAADSFIKSHPKWKFVFVNHVTTNPFFVPTIYGAQDACSLLGCSYQWTGSTTSDVSQMVNAFNSAISAKASGISCCLVDLKAFNATHGRRAQEGHSRARLQRGRACRQPERAPGLHRPGSVRVRVCNGPAHRQSGQGRGRRPLHRHAGAAEHPAADRRRNRCDQEVRRRQDQDDGGRHRRAPSRRNRQDRCLLPRAQVREGDVRGRCRLDAGGRPDGGEVRPAQEGREGRRVRPDADHAQADLDEPAGLHHRPAAVPPGLVAGAPAVLLQVLVGPRGTVQHEHRHSVRHEGERASRTCRRRPATRAAAPLRSIPSRST